MDYTARLESLKMLMESFHSDYMVFKDNSASLIANMEKELKAGNESSSYEDEDEEEEESAVIVTPISTFRQKLALSPPEPPASDILIYCDGSSTNYVGGIGVFIDHGHRLNVEKFIPGRCTNNIAELEALRESIRIVYTQYPEGLMHGNINSVTIRSDSMYAVYGVTEWIKKWRINGFLTTKGTPVENKDLYIVVADSYNALKDKLGSKLKVEHVKAHSTDQRNNIADAMAKAAVRKAQAYPATTPSQSYDSPSTDISHAAVIEDSPIRRKPK